MHFSTKLFNFILLPCMILVSVTCHAAGIKKTEMPSIIQDFIPITNRNRPGTLITPTYITVHNTANSNIGADAKAHANYVKNPNTNVSWQYTVDDKSIYQHLPTNELGWHAGTLEGNTNSIGIEICENSDGNLTMTEENAQELIRKVMTDLNITISKVVPHKYWSGKNCPHLLLPRWQAFLDGI